MSARTWQSCTLVLVIAASAAACDSPTGPDGTITPDSIQSSLIATYDAGLNALNSGEGCGTFNNDDGTLAWAQSYYLRSLIDAFVGTGRRSYLKLFVDQAELTLQQADVERGVEDYRGRTMWAWSSTKYSTEGQRAFWLIDDAMIVHPLLAFARVVLEDGALRREFGIEAFRYTAVARETIAKYDSLYRSDGVEGQYLLEAGFPAAIGHATERRPLPLNHDAAAGRVHALLWAVTNDENHRKRAVEIGRRVQRHLIALGDRYVWRYWGADGQLLFNETWEDVSHGAIAADFAALLNEEGLLFTDADLRHLGNTLLHQRGDTGFLRRVETTEADLTRPDAKCGYTWPRRYSDASGRWLGVQHAELYAAVKAYFDVRVQEENIYQDPHVLAGLAKLIRYYPGNEPES